MIANPLVIIKTAPNLTKPTLSSRQRLLPLSLALSLRFTFARCISRVLLTRQTDYLRSLNRFLALAKFFISRPSRRVLKVPPSDFRIHDKAFISYGISLVEISIVIKELLLRKLLNLWKHDGRLQESFSSVTRLLETPNIPTRWRNDLCYCRWARIIGIRYQNCSFIVPSMIFFLEDQSLILTFHWPCCEQLLHCVSFTLNLSTGCRSARTMNG